MQLQRQTSATAVSARAGAEIGLGARLAAAQVESVATTQSSAESARAGARAGSRARLAADGAGSAATAESAGGGTKSSSNQRLPATSAQRLSYAGYDVITDDNPDETAIKTLHTSEKNDNDDTSIYDDVLDVAKSSKGRESEKAKSKAVATSGVATAIVPKAAASTSQEGESERKPVRTLF